MKLHWVLKASRADSFLADGKMRFGHCSHYDDPALTAAQRDSEKKRSAHFSRTEIKIRTGPNPDNTTEVPFTSLEFSIDLPTYFLRALTNKWRPSMLKEFDADAAIELAAIPRWGRTAGKTAVGLRVATLSGFSPLPLRTAVLRYAPLLLIALLVYVVDWFVMPYWPIGVITLDDRPVNVWRLVAFIWVVAEIAVAFRTEGYRSIHDVWAATVVTDERARKQSA
jgi:hypothetical protein